MRHEKIILIVLSYIIGFTTAYISFGLVQDSESNLWRDNIHADAPVSGIQQTHADHATQVSFDETGMYAVVDGDVAVISGILTSGIDAGPGFHVAVPFYSVSPTGEYVYYCEQESDTDDFCHEYIYVVETHTSHPLKAGSDLLTSPLSFSAFSWTEHDDSALYKGMVSAGTDTPWRFVQSN